MVQVSNRGYSCMSFPSAVQLGVDTMCSAKSSSDSRPLLEL